MKIADHAAKFRASKAYRPTVFVAITALALLAVWLVLSALLGEPNSPPAAPASQPSSVSAPQAPAPPPVGFFALVIAIFSLILFAHVGPITLSSQSLGHRRNVFVLFGLAVLSEMYGLSITKYLDISDATPVSGRQLPIDVATKGIVGFLLIFSYFEYLANFLADYLRSRIDKHGKPEPDGVDKILHMVVGGYRVLFDFGLPLLLTTIVVLLYAGDVRAFLTVCRELLQTRYEYVANEYPWVAEVVQTAQRWIELFLAKSSK